MKLYKFGNTLLDLELIAHISYESSHGENDEWSKQFPWYRLNVKFILGVPDIDMYVYCGKGMSSGEEAAERVEQMTNMVEDLTKAWAECGREIPGSLVV